MIEIRNVRKEIKVYTDINSFRILTKRLKLFQKNGVILHKVCFEDIHSIYKSLYA